MHTYAQQRTPSRSSRVLYDKCRHTVGDSSLAQIGNLWHNITLESNGSQFLLEGE